MYTQQFWRGKKFIIFFFVMIELRKTHQKSYLSCSIW
jgi:hypothetical protein